MMQIALDCHKNWSIQFSNSDIDFQTRVGQLFAAGVEAINRLGDIAGYIEKVTLSYEEILIANPHYLLPGYQVELQVPGLGEVIVRFSPTGFEPRDLSFGINGEFPTTQFVDRLVADVRRVLTAKLELEVGRLEVLHRRLQAEKALTSA